jgi:hypothetical protein
LAAALPLGSEKPLRFQLPHQGIGLAGEGRWPGFAEAWRNLGATHLGINTMNAGLNAPQAHIDALRRVKEVIGL